MELGPGAIVGGKYRIERPLARGGMGSLWVARHMQLGSFVAIKFLDASFAASPAHRARFEREARAAATLRSPHVVQVHDYGFEGLSPYIVMELLEGEDLGHRLHRVRRVSLSDTSRILAQVAKALRKAHEAGIAHRDLKPANLFIARVDDEEVVKILDFGIAKEQHGTLGDATRTGEVIGSPHYMSPEQVRAEKDADHRSDLWSLGIILYRMLVGVLPFPGDQMGPVLARILTDPVPSASQVAPDLPRSLDAFFARALARDKLQRFQSVGEMVEAFHAAAGGREVFPSISMLPGSIPMAPPGGAAPAWGLPPAAPMAMGPSAPPSSPMTAGGPAPASGPITGSGPISSGAIAGSGPLGVAGHSVPPTGSVTTGGLVSSGAPPRPRNGNVLIAAGAVAAAAVAILIIAFVALSGSSDDAATGSTAEPAAPVPPATSTMAPSAEPIASANPAPTATAEPTPTAAEPAGSSTAAPAGSSTAVAGSSTGGTKSSGKQPKGTTTAKPKEKWF